MSGMTVKELIVKLETYDENTEVGHIALGWMPLINVSIGETPVYKYGDIIGRKTVVKLS